MIKIHSGKRGKYNNAATGTFFPSNPQKYKGSAAPIFKSALELRMMQYLDKSSSIVSWTYEPNSIRYMDRSECPPKMRRYFIDFVAVVQQGPIKKTVWLEVKPFCESRPPKNKNNVAANLLWLKNSSKWSAATQLARSKGFEFHVITEKELN